jgi:hypothetical protein
MNGLRLYTNLEMNETRGGYPVFYSRCQDGPYYRWSYSDDSREWQVGRLLPADVSRKMFESAAWKTIPVLLKRSLSDHYQID